MMWGFVAVAVAVHVGTCFIGFKLGDEKGRAWLGLLLAAFFSVLGLIVIAVLAPDTKVLNDRAFLEEERRR